MLFSDKKKQKKIFLIKIFRFLCSVQSALKDFLKSGNFFLYQLRFHHHGRYLFMVFLFNRVFVILKIVNMIDVAIASIIFLFRFTKKRYATIFSLSDEGLSICLSPEFSFKLWQSIIQEKWFVIKAVFWSF